MSRFLIFDKCHDCSSEYLCTNFLPWKASTVGIAIIA
jgi:hypothetical protein